MKYPYNINSLAQQAVAERLTEDIAPQVAAGSVLLAGPVPQDPARGGILVVKTDDVAAFCQADPFVQRGVQRYDVIPFRVFDGQATV